MYTAEKMLQIFASQIGYTEKMSSDKLDSMSDNAGDKNYTKYARDLYDAGYYQASKQGCEWCDMIFDWCALQMCGSREKAEKLTCQTGLYGAGCEWSARYYKDQGRFYTSDPKPGDQIFFDNFNHTGIVEDVVNGMVKTIEGNVTNKVVRRAYSIGSSRIDGYGRPHYDSEETPEQETPAASLNIGDVVAFTGSRHYISATSRTGFGCKPGLAEITAIKDGTDHPIHLINVAGGESTVFGWVNIEEVKARQDTTDDPEEPCSVALPALKAGCEGETVRAMQILLIWNDCSCGENRADGEFGTETEKAVKTYQERRGLIASGICESDTWRKLLGL